MHAQPSPASDRHLTLLDWTFTVTRLQRVSMILTLAVSVMKWDLQRNHQKSFTAFVEYVRTVSNEPSLNFQQAT